MPRLLLAKWSLECLMEGRTMFGAIHLSWDLHGLGGSQKAFVCQPLLVREGEVLLLSFTCSWWLLAIVPEC